MDPHHSSILDNHLIISQRSSSPIRLPIMPKAKKQVPTSRATGPYAHKNVHTPQPYSGSDDEKSKTPVTPGGYDKALLTRMVVEVSYSHLNEWKLNDILRAQNSIPAIGRQLPRRSVRQLPVGRLFFLLMYSAPQPLRPKFHRTQRSEALTCLRNQGHLAQGHQDASHPRQRMVQNDELRLDVAAEDCRCERGARCTSLAGSSGLLS